MKKKWNQTNTSRSRETSKQWDDWERKCNDKRTHSKSLEINPKFDWVQNLDNIIENINNYNHKITGFTPNEIESALKNDDHVILDSAREKELKIKKGNISKEVYIKGDLVRFHQPS